jgi:3-oxoacyl-[acyl-carrier-protein] synthase II
MRADVPITTTIDLDEPQAHGSQSVGFDVDTSDAAPMRDAPRVAVTSWGAHTVFGDLTRTWDRLLRGDSTDDHARVTDVGERCRALALARSVTSGLRIDRDAAVVAGTSKGSIEEWFSTSDNPLPGLSAAGLGDIAATLAADFRTRGPVLTLSAACASGLHALVRGAMLIQSGETRQALVVATEASVHPLFLGSFQRLGVLAKPGAGCRPFDRNRTGFYMTEAACVVLLEASDPSNASAPLCVERFALGGDATHLTGGDPDARLLRHLLNKVIDGGAVDLVHAHGTGTELNDDAELAAVESSLRGCQRPTVLYSHKAALGHSLGASGLLSIVLNCQSHATGTIPPNVRTTDPLPAKLVSIPQTVTRRPVRRSVAIAAGFGGATAVVSLCGP